jgi:hypothetical protein
LWTISSMTERTTSARRAWSRRSGKSAGRSIVRPAFLSAAGRRRGNAVRSGRR